MSAAGVGTDGRTDGRPFHRPCSAYYARSVNDYGLLVKWLLNYMYMHTCYRTNNNCCRLLCRYEVFCYWSVFSLAIGFAEFLFAVPCMYNRYISCPHERVTKRRMTDEYRG